MLIQYTPEEEKHREEMRLEFTARLIDAKDEKEKKALLLQFQTERDKYAEACELKRFKKLGKNHETILNHAKEQAEALLEMEYNSLINYAKSDEIAQLGIGCMKGGKFHISAGFMAGLIKTELHFHIDALKNDQERLQALFAYIVEIIDNSEYTDTFSNEDITELMGDNANTQAVELYRRSPLANIEKIGIMSDKLNATMLTDPSGMLEDLLTEEANGQLRLFWSVIQTKKGQEQVAVMASLSLPPGYEGLSRKISGFDLAVYSAISDIFAKWVKEKPFTPLLVAPADIWRRMNGKQPNDGKKRPSPLKEKQICDSIEKMRHMDFYIQLDEELKAGRITLDDSRLINGKYTDYFLNCSIVEFTNEKGVNMKGYLISPDKMPILYAYNLAKGNIRSLPFELLDTSDALSDTDYVTELKFYLLRQIQYMQSQAEKAISDKKNKQRINPDNIILLETMYKGAGIPTPEERAIEWAKSEKTTEKKAIDNQTRKNRKTDKGKIESILNSWISKKWIKGYAEIKGKNKTTLGYSIKL